MAERGEYRLSVCYRALPGRQVNPEASFTLTGEGVSLKQSAKFARRWLDLRMGDRFEKDSGGNEVLPKSFEESVWQQAVYGLSGEQGSAAVALEAGEYTLTITMSAESVELAISACCPTPCRAMRLILPLPEVRIARMPSPSVWKRN